MAEIQFDVELTVELLPENVEKLTDTPDGPVGLLVKAAADTVLKFAQSNIGDYFGGHHPGPRLKDTGKVVPVGGAAYAVIFSKPLSGDLDLAVLHHEGAQGHPISPKPGKVLFRNAPTPVGYGENANRFFRRVTVQHPGHLGNPYLTDAADTAGLTPSGTLLRGRRPTSIFRLRQP